MLVQSALISVVRPPLISIVRPPLMATVRPPLMAAINAECSLGNHALIQSISLSKIKQGFDALPLEKSPSSCSLFSSPQNLNE